MAASLKVLVPEATVNYIQNPSFRYDTTGWNAVGSVISRVLTYALFGIASLMVTTDGLVMREGVYYRVNDLVGISESITISAYVRGDGMIHLRLIDSGGKEWVSPAIDAHPDIWQRLEISGFSTGSNDMRLYVETDGSAKAVTFYVDGCQMERKSYATTYCDGDQPGCRWNIMDSASNASRDADTRLGGRWVPLAGPCREDNDIYITVLGGLGMAPIQNNTQPWALAPGSYYQNTKVLDRVVTFNFNVKKEFLPIVRKVNLGPLHEMRQQLIDIFKPDLTGGGEPFLFSYQEEGGREMFINMRYEAGLEGDWDLRNQWAQSFPVRFLAEDPYFTELNYHAQELIFKDEAFLNNVAGRVDGRWINLNYGVGSDSGTDNTTNQMALGRKGEIYLTGLFTKANYSALAIDPFIPGTYITYWNGSKWNVMGTPPNNSVIDVAVAPNGNVYVGGSFTSIGGVAANRIAYWNGTGWNALGTGLNGSVYRVRIAPNGDVYAGGAFTTAGGIPAYYIARWDGSIWHAMGATGGLDDNVFSMDITPDGKFLYVGGYFHNNYSIAGSTLLHVAKYDVEDNLFSAMGSGVDDLVRVIKISPSGVIYIGGDFENSGSVVMSNIAKWNGSTWVGLGTGMNTGGVTTVDNVYGIIIENESRVYALGGFGKAGDINSRFIALWNGSTWVNTDLTIAGDLISSAAAFTGVGVHGDIYICGKRFSNTSDTLPPGSIKSLFSHINIIDNIGTTETKPIIYVYGPGHLRWIENQTTRKTIYLDLNILDNEEVFFDFGKGKVWSTIRGDLSFAVRPGSDFSDFALSPGENKLAIFMTDDVNSSMYIYYQPRHWSIDATIHAEPLY